MEFGITFSPVNEIKHIRPPLELEFEVFQVI